MVTGRKYGAAVVADLLSVPVKTVHGWVASGRLTPVTGLSEGTLFFDWESLKKLPQLKTMDQNVWEREAEIKPLRDYTSIELFAGAGGLALGLERAGFEHVLLNEFNGDACRTLRQNRSQWQVKEGDVSQVDFTPWRGIDLVSGGFPCQAFSYAGKRAGFEDTRGTLFFQFARVIRETQPRVFLGENVKGLLSHDGGKTLETIRSVITELGYTLIEPHVLRAIFYQVPQKRERLMLVAIRNDLVEDLSFQWPSPAGRIYTLRDALCKGVLFDCDVPLSSGQVYPMRKAEVLAMVPPGGCWRDLPNDVQRAYMKGSYFLGGGKTGMARRLAWDAPSLTLTCSPAQSQTERCHPDESRPLTVREYARIQTFPDQWQFVGSMGSQYRQIGNAVPVNLAHAVGRKLIDLLNQLEDKGNHLRFAPPAKTSSFIQETLLEKRAHYNPERK